MKPKEIIEKYGCSFNGRKNGGYCNFFEYENCDCVVAYSVNDLGLFILIKGARKYFSFISLKAFVGGFENRLFRDRDDIIKFSLLKNLVIVDKDEYEKYKNKMFLKEL